MAESDASKFRDSNCKNCEINSRNAKPERQKPDERASDSGDWYRRDKSEPWCNAEVNEQPRCRIRAEANVQRVAERQVSGEAGHDVPSLPREGKIENQNEDGEEIVTGEEGNHDRQKQQCGQCDQCTPRDAIQQTAHHAALRPRSPCGRNTRMSASMAKTNMLLADGEKSRPATASVTPINTPPSRAPGIDPRPPVITITKARSV